jgi:DNA mismatch repair protein MutL
LQLTDSTINKIAAGEVIERPASVVKELVENAIDADSTQIDIEIEDAGLKLLKVSDNGIGMAPDDAKLAFGKHTTSKITDLNDLETLSTLGFRGEALPSIAAVARIELITKQRQAGEDKGTSSTGKKLKLEAGKIISEQDAGCPEGTIIKIEDLFFNVPARKKFLKSKRTELAHITDWVMRFALVYNNIRFKLIKDGTELMNTPATGEPIDTIASIFGSSFTRELIPVKYSSKLFELKGFIGKPILSRRDTSYHYIYVNGRYVNSKLLNRALREAYHTLLMKNRYPTAIINLQIDPSKIDVNIHPTKLTIRFMEDKKIYPELVGAIKSVLEESNLIPELELDRAGDKKLMSIATQQIITEREDSKSDPLQSPGDVSLEGAESKTPEYSERNESPAEQLELPSEGIKTSKMNQTALNIVPLSPILEELPDERIIKPIDTKFNTYQVSDMKKDTALGFRPLCQLHDSFILAQSNEGLLIIDQHALHERIMYEKLKGQYEASPMLTQELIMPVTFELNTRDYQVLMGYSTLLEDLGFLIEPFGKNTVRVRAVPTVLGKLEDQQVLNELLDDLLALGRISSEELQREKIIQIMACKSAVKAGQKLSEHEVVELLSALPELTSPFTCAHGRPTILSVPLRELEKQFKRT